MVNAIEAVDVTKVYRRYARKRQFATLKSALLSGSLIRDLNPNETFNALQGVTFSVPKGSTYAIVGRNGSGKSTMLEVRRRHHQADDRAGDGERARVGADRARRRASTRRSPAARTCSSTASCSASRKREITRRFDEIVEFAELEDFIDAPVKTYSSGMYMRLGLRGGDPRGSRTCCWSTRCWRWATRASPTSASTSSRTSAAAARPFCS